VTGDDTPTDLGELLAGVNARLDHATGAMRVVAAAITGAQAEQTRLARRSRLERVVALGALALLTLSTVALAAGVLSIRHITSGTNDNSRVLIDCTTPGHPCYERGQQATATAIKQIVEAQTVAAWCGAHRPTLAGARACTARHLR
jgi:hypothetical protein